jgi:hypothetical protein
MLTNTSDFWLRAGTYSLEEIGLTAPPEFRQSKVVVFYNGCWRVSLLVTYKDWKEWRHDCQYPDEDLTMARLVADMGAAVENLERKASCPLKNKPL